MVKMVVIICVVLGLIITISTHGLTLPFRIQNFTNYSKVLRNLDSIESIRTEYQTSQRTVVNLCLGYPPQCFDLVIQTNSFFLWVNDGNSTNQSSSIHKMDIYNSDQLERYIEIPHKCKYSSKFVNGYQAYDTLWVGKTQVKRFQFLLATSTDYDNIDGMIGLGYEPATSEIEYSFIHQLYNKEIITHRVFIQEFLDRNSGLLHIGKIPQEIIDNLHKTCYCKALDVYKDTYIYRNKNWECELSGIFYGNDTINPDIHKFEAQKISFFSYRKRTLIPPSMHEHFKTTYFNQAINEGKCKEYSSKRYKSFECEVIDDSLQDINLVFSNSVMKFKPKDLFYKMDDIYMFILYKKKNITHWVLGRSILKLFHIIYDSQYERIGFYNKEDLVFSLNYNKTTDIPSTEEDYDNHKKPITDIVDGPLEKKERRKLSNAFIVQVIFASVIVIAVIVLGIIGFFSYRRYRRKTKFPSHNYFYQKTDKLMGEGF